MTYLYEHLRQNMTYFRFPWPKLFLSAFELPVNELLDGSQNVNSLQHSDILWIANCLDITYIILLI